MKISFNLLKAELKLFIRNYINLFFTLVFPGLMLLLFGGIYGNSPSEMFNGYGTIDVSIPAYFAMIISVTGVMSVPISIANYRERKILKRYMVTPIKVRDILIAQFVVNLLMTLLGIMLLLIVGKVIYDIKFLGTIFSFTLLLLFCILVIFSIGLLIGSIASNTKNANAISNTIYFPMLFLSGATIPIEIFPKNMLIITKFIPLTYVVRILKGTWLGNPIGNYVQEIIFLFIILVVCLVVSIKSFKWE
ncbi:ABC transporter permease [Clostridium sp. CF011]|uniref:ABC transporter permease n=1 Tax=Clostridium sp. CF011 TaxID=2843318 RepID=UPI001C0B7BD5|nr:ABC transporter permease [Clostridium sp. CF011]MBU3093529.1 ABC transporter permease [Clostridium sp. CF011]WAG71734.1 ABC transporter permease [Clostridium sp. CF011]